MSDFPREPTEQELFDMDLEMDKVRVKEMGYIFRNIPLDARHGIRVLAMQQNRSLDPLARFRQPPTGNSQSPAGSSSRAGESFTPDIQSNSTALALSQGQAAIHTNPCLQFVSMYSEAEDNWLPFSATLDTGTPANWVGEHCLGPLALEPTIAASVEYLDFSGKTIKSSSVVVLNWCAVGGRKGKIRKAQFRVAQSAPFDVILGSQLLVIEEGILVFNETAWVLAKKNPTKEEKLYMESQRAKAAAETKALAEQRRSQSSRIVSGQQKVPDAVVGKAK